MATNLYPVYTIKQTSSKCILNTRAHDVCSNYLFVWWRLLDVYSMFAWSCKRGITHWKKDRKRNGKYRVCAYSALI